MEAGGGGGEMLHERKSLLLIFLLLLFTDLISIISNVSHFHIKFIFIMFYYNFIFFWLFFAVIIFSFLARLFSSSSPFFMTVLIAS